MYAAVSHPYLTQAIALWLSFVPALLIIAIAIAAQAEAFRRAGKPVTKEIQRCNLR